MSIFLKEIIGIITNTGSVPGKSVVEVYAQTPYGDYEIKNKVEKSAVQLVGFTKTEEIPAGETVNFEVTVKDYFLASYDYTAAKGYILSAGDYYLAVGDNAHDALNNILAAKGMTGMVDQDGNPAAGNSAKTYTWHQDALDTESYKYSETGVQVTNQLDFANLNTYIENGTTYLTRNDWENTFPVKATEITATAELIAKITSIP